MKNRSLSPDKNNDVESHFLFRSILSCCWPRPFLRRHSPLFTDSHSSRACWRPSWLWSRSSLTSTQRKKNHHHEKNTNTSHNIITIIISNNNSHSQRNLLQLSLFRPCPFGIHRIYVEEFAIFINFFVKIQSLLSQKQRIQHLEIILK